MIRIRRSVTDLDFETSTAEAETDAAMSAVSVTVSAMASVTTMVGSATVGPVAIAMSRMESVPVRVPSPGWELIRAAPVVRLQPRVVEPLPFGVQSAAAVAKTPHFVVAVDRSVTAAGASSQALRIGERGGDEECQRRQKQADQRGP